VVDHGKELAELPDVHVPPPAPSPPSVVAQHIDLVVDR
jgi:hypothetical protein